jgi:hypothetical protein
MEISMFKSLKLKVLAFLLGLTAVAGVATAANTFYAGFNPATNATGTIGTDVLGGPIPVVTGTAGCGTITAVTGGTSAGQFTLGTFTTSCAITITLPVPTFVVSSGNNDGKNAVNSAAAPNGLLCIIQDLTTGADKTYQVSTTTTACVFNAATFVTGDVLQYSISAY